MSSRQGKNLYSACDRLESRRLEFQKLFQPVDLVNPVFRLRVESLGVDVMRGLVTFNFEQVAL